ncbi:hypothetical protein TorRG33x02_066570 [Trema orientale]|uniref:RNase H type-1 domain-containing protein n=1 Tax=Trema orientale TaxID=63057 RepID=A0A2P5FI21_TREOI|nr:hypothetical protein TorRG33x02_066570 [Trema orientale]
MAEFQTSASKKLVRPSLGKLPHIVYLLVLYVFKLNTDVVVRSSERFVGIGEVICDHLECVVACWALKLPGFFSPEIGELLAIREGLRICLVHHFLV